MTTAAWIILFVLVMGTLVFAGFVGGVATAYFARAMYLGPARPTLSTLQWASLVVREAVAQMRIIFWFVTRRGAGDMGSIPGDPSDDHVVPVVLAHGLAADGTCMWALRAPLLRRGRPTYAPHLGRMLRPLEAYAALLEQALDRALLEHPTAEGVDVVAHSMGGIALRHTLRVRPDIALRVRRVVTIASPHAGTMPAQHIPTVEAQALFPGAAWLSGLPSLRRLLPLAPITTIASRHDAVVYPHDTCTVEGATHHELERVGHAELLLHPRVVELVVGALT
jgi:triacylglycerol lipase